MIYFSDKENEQPKILIRYVFDWNTGEISNLSFELSPAELEKLLNQLRENKHSVLDKPNANGLAFFEWHLSNEGEILFRLKGRSQDSLIGPSQYEMQTFATLMSSTSGTRSF
jgi:hypothetical protein